MYCNEIASISFEEAQVRLPQGQDWQKQLEAERMGYEREWERRRKGNERFNPFGENMYGRPLIPFGPYFIHLSEINNGTSVKGAFYRYRTLCAVPEGYSYHGNVESARVSDYQPLGVQIVSDSAHDLDGNLMDGYVSIAVQKSATQSI